MVKEIIVNAGELESRVAILENGRLMELHIEREPKIVGNIYKARVTKVLKGMDAAFVDIGIERNAFLSVSDVVPQEEDDSPSGNGRPNRRNLPPITELLKANQELLIQVARAPMGTKGARVTTRLSLPGRYLVLMLNSGGYTGVSRKVADPAERQRLRGIATRLRPDGYSLIVRTEAEGKTEEELAQDVAFLVEIAKRIEGKSASAPTPALIHGDMNLVLRLIRDAFTRDVSRVVVDAPSTYESVMELVGLIAPHLRNRVFLYDDPLPVFHTYNIEPEIERTLRRKIWLPSGGYLIIDQAEALTAIDVNTGRFVGSIELAETVLTTNLQACDEVARQLRLRDLGGIIVVDFIDMDNPRHRQQVTRAFEEALRRDRAKIKVHSISSLGLVEMTRKRTGDSMVSMLTEPCPYCSGIGRVQSALTMALRIERELAATAVTHPETEAFLVIGHPRVIASMLGYEGEAHRDLEAYLERPVYLRLEENYHANTYRLERLTLEQALVAVPLLDEGAIIEGQVVNADPEVSLAPLVHARGMILVVPDLDAPVGARVKVRVRDVGTSVAMAEPLAEELRAIRSGALVLPLERPSLVAETILPAYLREERATVPPRGHRLLSPTAEQSVGEEEEPQPVMEESRDLGRRRPKMQRRRRGEEREVILTPGAEFQTMVPDESMPEELVTPEELSTPEIDVEEMTEEITSPLPDDTVLGEQAENGDGELRRRSRRRRRRRGRGGAVIDEPILPNEPRTPQALEGRPELLALPDGKDATAAALESRDALTDAVVGGAYPGVAADAGDGSELGTTPEDSPSTSRRRRRNRGGRRGTPAPLAPQESAEELLAELPDDTLPTPVLEPEAPIPLAPLTQAEAAHALRSLIDAMPEPEAVTAPTPETGVEDAKPRGRTPRARRARAPRETASTEQLDVPAPAPASEVVMAPVVEDTPLPLESTEEVEVVTPAEEILDELAVEPLVEATDELTVAPVAAVIEEPSPRPRRTRIPRTPRAAAVDAVAQPAEAAAPAPAVVEATAAPEAAEGEPAGEAAPARVRKPRAPRRRARAEQGTLEPTDGAAPADTTPPPSEEG
jgi:ribonuclease G